VTRSRAPIWILSPALIAGLGFAFLSSRPAGGEVSPPRIAAGAVASPVYPIRVTRVIDGDSFEAMVPIWPGQTLRTVIRIEGVDAPELRGRCAAERRRARAAKAALERIALREALSITRVEKDKFGGRHAALVLDADGAPLAARLIAAGHARAYEGGRRRSWCAGSQRLP
jgi:endonuclease YncB( thermonuclease family)